MNSAFAAAAAVLASQVGLTATQARGTLRLALKLDGIDPRIARRDDLVHALPHLHHVVATYRIHLEERQLEAIRTAIETAPETSEDALDFFKDID